jgi:hypothetical protein
LPCERLDGVNPQPRSEVAAYAADAGNATAWYESIRAVEWETPPPVGVGSRLGFVARFLRRELRYTYSKIAEFYEDEVAASIKALTSILEQAMIILVGSIVGFIVISMYLPMFKVYDAIK